MKKAISICELILGYRILSSSTIILATRALYRSTINIRYIILLLIIILILVANHYLVVGAIIRLNQLFRSKDLPLDCLRNCFGYIEIHAEQAVDWNVFFIRCLEAVKIGIDEERDILIDTWLIKKENIVKYFGDAAEFKEPSCLQKWVNCLNKQKHDPQNTRKAYRCILHIDKITDEQIQNINWFIEGVEARSMRRLKVAENKNIQE